MSSVVLLPIGGLPSVHPGQDLGGLLGDAIEAARYGLKDGDVVVVCQKVVSKAEGRVVKLTDVEPSARAREFAAAYEKDPALVELALREATEVLRMGNGHLITATAKGFISANSGIDRSNQAHEGEVTLLPVDADRSAEQLRTRLLERFGVGVAVIITDTFGRPWRLGQIDFAIGAAGLRVLDDHLGRRDWSGRGLEHTVIAVADQLAAAAGLVMGKAAGIPAVLIRGYRYEAGDGTAGDLVRPPGEDLFR
ncbi:MAG TPA: coenzyme F420-0:L-glutamate ligase [Candidatus Limnocylindrales bacterium]|nr:coenzyme F420-0:L-glutamate ligase [Candidatus Limnocylindrales bacterium]